MSAGGPFAALRHRDFRLLLGGMLFGSLAMPMQWVTQMWLVLELAAREHAPLWLGITGFTRGLPLLLLSLYGGVTADRMDRRRLLLVSQSCSALVALGAGLLVLAEWINLWLVVVLTLAGSAVMSFDQPTRQALVPDLVRGENVAGAVALNSMVMFAAMAVGPALAGFLIGTIGIAGAFLVIAAVYLPVIAAVALMRTRTAPRAGPRRSVAGDIREGLRYVRGEPVVRWLVAGTFAITMLGMAFTNLGPVLLRDELGAGEVAFGLTMTAWGIGAIGASLALTLSLRQMRGYGPLLLGAAAVFGAGLTGFAYAPSVPVAALLQLIPGMAHTVFMVVGNAAILAVTPAEVRGRVMGIYMMNRGLMPVGALLAGLLGAVLGVRAGIALLALSSTGAVGVLTLLQPGVWRRLDAALIVRPSPEPQPAFRGER